MTGRGWRKPFPVIARLACAVAIQFFLVTPGLPRFARNDGERLAETCPCHCEARLRRGNPVLSSWLLDCRASLAMTGRGRRKPFSVIARRTCDVAIQFFPCGSWIARNDVETIDP